ncbi:myosin fused to IQ motif and Rcc1 domain [Cryptosporidium canis]|uniref:Myosin fused to IQ motif and Rcc1 domain n=1 Tax=Cryptosporidium canis TaxID=195482 RepID=A0A9D5HYX2_9CRYT|nr:myosin fused to IQ motif and Rcc1 domain [Cryptosporidium canis]
MYSQEDSELEVEKNKQINTQINKKYGGKNYTTDQNDSIIPFGIPVWVHNEVDGVEVVKRGVLRNANLGKNAMVEFSSVTSKNILTIKSYPKDKIGLIIDNPIKSPDLSLLDVCTPHGISHMLAERCAAGCCYTFSGNLLLFILPRVEKIPRLMEAYSSLEIQRFWTEMKTKFEPHIFSLARRALVSWAENHQDQSIVIMGTQNTGKCFNLHMLIRFLAKNLSLYKYIKSSYTISEKIASIVHITRSFIQTPGEGNNGDNKFYHYGQSYCGQIWRIFVARDGCLLGSHVHLWSFNTSPVSYWSRNGPFFSIFYQLAHGLILDSNNPIIKSLGLFKHEVMIYLAQVSPEMNTNYIDQLRGFKMTVGSLNSLGLNDTQKIDFFKILFVIVSIDSYISVSHNSDDKDSENYKVVFFPTISRLLGVDIEDLKSNFTTCYEFAQLQVTLYCRLLDWVVFTCNENLRPTTTNLLGIESFNIVHGPGFLKEGFSFSNAMQNYCEEKLKKNFIFESFTSEKKILESEGLNMIELSYSDIDSITDLFEENEKGLMNLLKITSKRQRRVEEFINEMQRDNIEMASAVHKPTPCDEFGRIDLEPSRSIYSKFVNLYIESELLTENDEFAMKGESKFNSEPYNELLSRKKQMIKVYHDRNSEKIRKYRRMRLKRGNRASSMGKDLFAGVANDIEAIDFTNSVNSSVLVEDEHAGELPEYLPPEITINHSFGKCTYSVVGMAEEDNLNQVPERVDELFRKSHNKIIRACWTTLMEVDERYSQEKNAYKNFNQKKKTKLTIDEDPDVIKFEAFWKKIEDFMDFTWMRLSAIPGSPSSSQIAIKSAKLVDTMLKRGKLFFAVCASSYQLDKDTEEEVSESKITDDLEMYNVSSQVLLQQYGFTVKIPLRIFLVKFSEIYIPRIHKKGILEKLKSQQNLRDSIRTLLHGLEVPEIEYLIGTQHLFLRNKMVLVLERRREEYLKKALPATIVLQNAWRTLKPRQFVSKLRLMSVRIQSLIRMRFVCLLWKKILPYRQFICGLALLIHLAFPWVKTSTIFDKLEELAQQREDERKFFRNSAATSIQAWWRGEMVRRRLTLYRYNEFREFSIQVIQSAWRTLKAQAILVEKLAFTKTPNFKAVKIQAVFRGWLVRKKFCKLFMLKRCILSLKRKSLIRLGIAKHIEYRGTLRRSHVFREQIRAHREVVNKAIIIQRVFRMALCRRQYMKLRFSAKVVQCRAYTCLEVYRYYKAIKSITFLQQWWRVTFKLREHVDSGNTLVRTLSKFKLQKKITKDPVKKLIEMNNLVSRELKQFNMMRYPLLSMQGLFQPLAKIVESNTVFLNPVELSIVKDIGDYYPSTWGRGFVTLCRRLCGAIFETAPTKQFPPLKILQFSVGQRHTLVLIAERILAGQGDENIDIDTFDHKKSLESNFSNNGNSGALLGQTSGKLLNFEYRNHVYSWGVNDQGQLGVPIMDIVSSNIREPVKFLDSEYRYTRNEKTGRMVRYLIRQVDYTRRIRWVGCGSDHSMAITADGKLFTWGENIYGQCGHGHNYSYILNPKMVEPLKEEQVYMASAGSRHCGVVTQNGAVFMWGAGTHVCLEDYRFKSLYGHLKEYDEVANSSNFYEPFRVELPISENSSTIGDKNATGTSVNNSQKNSGNKHGGVRQILCGNGFNIICTHSLFIWGRNDKGQLGMSNKGHLLKPNLLPLPTVDLLKLEYTGELKKEVRRRSLLTLISGNKIIISSISAGPDFVCATIEDGFNVMYLWGNFTVHEQSSGSSSQSSMKSFGFSKVNLKPQSSLTISNRAIQCPTIVRHSLWENKVLTQVACTVNSVAVITDDSELFGFELVSLQRTDAGKSEKISFSPDESITGQKLDNWGGVISARKKQKNVIDKKKTTLPEICKDLNILRIPERYKSNLNDLFYFEPSLYQYRCVPNTKKAGLLTEEVISSISSTMSILWVKHRRKTYVSQFKGRSEACSSNIGNECSNENELFEGNRENVSSDAQLLKMDEGNVLQKVKERRNMVMNRNMILHRIQPKSYIPSYLFHDPQRVLGNGYGNDSVFVELLRRIKNKNKKSNDDSNDLALDII